MFPYVNVKISLILVFLVLFPQDEIKALYLAAGSALQINDSCLPSCIHSLSLECGANLNHTKGKKYVKKKKEKTMSSIGYKNAIFGRQGSKWSSDARARGIIQSEITVS